MSAALELQIELTAIVTRGKSVPQLLSHWQAQTGEAVAVFDRLPRVLGRSAGFRPRLLGAVSEALAEGPPRLGETRDLTLFADDGEPLRVTVDPFAGSDTVRGFVARIPAGSGVAELTAPALHSLLALDYERRWLLDEPARRQRADDLGRVLAFGDEGRVRILLRRNGIDSSELRGLVIEARSETHAEVLVDDLAALLSAPLIRHNGRIVECLVHADPRQALTEYGLDVPIGVGTAAALQHAARTVHQATLALEASRRVGAPIEYRDGASHDLLIRAANPELLEAFADAALLPVERARGGQTLLRTLHTWLTESRSIEATASRMSVHRHTVRNHIQRIAQLTGHDLDSIDTQTELWLALKVRGL
ncbi:MAG: helix-turn-helix domain-containing protein [Microbacterium sp.]